MLARWRDQPDGSPDGYVGERDATALGYHTISATFTLGGRTITLTTPGRTVRGDVHDRGPDSPHEPHLHYNAAWLTNHMEMSALPVGESAGLGSGKVEVGVVVGGCYDATVSVSLRCTFDTSAFQAWQIETYDRIHEAHRAAADAYREALNAARIQRDQGVSERSPQRNAEIVVEELKRQVIELMLTRTQRGYNLKAADPEQGTINKLRESVAVAPLIQFVEQAFEWKNMTYILYPYYWADEHEWKELLAIDGTDANFVRFLRCGSARVVVPARPHFEDAVLYFANYGDPWLGDTPPIPESDLYVSVAQEIQELRHGPDDGEPGELWEERLPTTLVWLDRDSGMPKHNMHPRLDGTPVIDLCGGGSR